MFWSGPSSDLKIIIFLLVISVAVASFVYFKTKKILLGVFILSVLSNLILFYGMYYQFAEYYNIMWLFKFVRKIWPYMNLALFISLIIIFFKNKYAKNKNK
ncbi:MAG: hypothetical protein A2271_00995 [Candidatus Moranbacteria bacterium RIFOXYA12_FULL_35_19]|nr:MAG: hypothetical protein UR78_C0005G0039 [Candidatus Moranbacteria bacterium GW2011_GWF2_35_39]OGI30690.1 MAG: hypothetical protein A2343_01060 [Candidatus Moranbacteria bacterium RIFOXYB12_FULL_35_8]OGI32607.1 MAG: hypothetical protein A2489_02780 [Candidatus Moranbacteria bacterium RIFOXYC12_FULL_36_13]OGI36478.1 MAG: hypothetical protein A2271_00995 [Candidatus Moranbacteria bacterium RIFOXYA12_FULL_35_19]